MQEQETVSAPSAANCVSKASINHAQTTAPPPWMIEWILLLSWVNKPKEGNGVCLQLKFGYFVYHGYFSLHLIKYIALQYLSWVLTFWHSLKFCTVLTSPSSQAEEYLLTPEDITSYSMQSMNVSFLEKQMWLSERFWDYEKIILDFSAGP